MEGRIETKSSFYAVGLKWSGTFAEAGLAESRQSLNKCRSGSMK